MPDLLPTTPAVSFHHLTDSHAVGTEPVLAAIGARVGELFAYREWDAAQLVQNRYPVAAHREVQTASGFGDLVLHTEACFTSYPPDFLALLGLRPDATGAARTLVADIPLALRLLGEAELRALSEPLFVFEPDRGSHVHNGLRTTAPVSMLRDHGQGSVLEYSTLLIATTKEGGRALAGLNAALNRCAVSVALGHGDLLLIDNRRTVHGRTAFRPAYDGSDRWIQRVLLLGRLPADGRIVPDTRLVHYPTDYLNALALPA